MHGLLRYNINTGVHAHACRADESLRDVTMAQLGNGASKCEWRHAPEARGWFLGFWRSQLESWVETCLGRWGGVRWKSQNRKNVYLSPYVEEPLNSMVIKSFIPELRSRKCFSCFEIPMFYVYIYIYEHYMSISHIAISGYGTNIPRPTNTFLKSFHKQTAEIKLSWAYELL